MIPAGFLALVLPLLVPAEGGAEPKPPAPAATEDPREKDFNFRVTRARTLATQAAARSDAGMAKEAFDLFLAAAHLKPKDPVPLCEAGLLALDFGDEAGAQSMIRALVDLDPASGPCHYLRGCHLQARSEFADARADFAASKAAAYRPIPSDTRHFQCTVGLGLQYEAAQLHDAAVKTLSEAVAARPDDPLNRVAYFNMAVAYRRLQAPKEAERVLRLSMERFPNYAPAYGELGELLAELDRFDDADAVFNAAVNVDPAYARGWLLKAGALASRGKFKEAAAALAEHDKRFKPSGLSEYHRGVLLQKTGEPKKAIESLQRSLALDSTMVRAVYFLALCHRDLGNEKEQGEYMDRWKKVEAENKKREDEEAARARERLGPAPPKDAPKDGGGR